MDAQDVTEEELRAALAGQALVTLDRFTSAGRTCVLGPMPIPASQPRLSVATVWRIAPAPLEHHEVFFNGGKNQAHDKPALIVEELAPQHLRPTDRATGQPMRRYVIDGVDTEKLSLADADTLRAYPGATT